MNLAVVGIAYGHPGKRYRGILKQIAFLGRYAHQPFDVCIRMSVNQRILLAQATAEIMKEESDRVKNATDID